MRSSSGYHYLAKLACTDPHIAREVSHRVILNYPTGQAAGLAMALLKVDCAPVKELPELIKEHLRKAASGG